MYNEHFGLRQAPFRITPDTRLFYTGGGRGDVLDALVYAITSGEGIVKVVGEVGTGKTMLCRMLEERLPDNVKIAYLANPSLTPDDILHAIALELELDVPPGATRLQVMHRLQETLLALHARNRRVVALVEEAQRMPVDTLEEIRLLSNLETKDEKLLQIVLFGQPELDDNLALAGIRQLRERITHSFRLAPLARDEIKDYVAFRLRASGYRGRDAFSDDAYRAMSRASEGLTRRVNIIADKAMLAAYAENTHDVSARHVKVAIRDSEFDAATTRRTRGPSRLAIAAAVAVASVLAGAAGWYLGQRELAPSAALVPGASASASAAQAPTPLVRATAVPDAAAAPAPVAVAGNDGNAAGGGARDGAAPRVAPAPPTGIDTAPRPMALVPSSAPRAEAQGAAAGPAAAAPAATTSIAAASERPTGPSADGQGAAATADVTSDEPPARRSVPATGTSAGPVVAAPSTSASVTKPATTPPATATSGFEPASMPPAMATSGFEPATTPPAMAASASEPGAAPSATATAAAIAVRAAPDSALVPPAASAQTVPAALPPAVTKPAAMAQARAAPRTMPSAPEAAAAPAIATREAGRPSPHAITGGTAVTAAGTAAEPAARAGTAPAPPAPDDAQDAGSGLLESRLVETRAWLQRVNPGHFSIQLLATDARQRSNLEAFLRRRGGAAELDTLYVYETHINERLWFGVLYGEFDSIAAAREALRSLPKELLRHSPFIRNIRDINSLG